MAKKVHELNPDESTRYRIHALGVLSPRWLDMLSGNWTIVEQPAAQSGATVLVGQVVDQAALMGVLNQLYDLGLCLLSVECLMDGKGGEPKTNSQPPHTTSLSSHTTD